MYTQQYWLSLRVTLVNTPYLRTCPSFQVRFLLKQAALLQGRASFQFMLATQTLCAPEKSIDSKINYQALKLQLWSAKYRVSTSSVGSIHSGYSGPVWGFNFLMLVLLHQHQTRAEDVGGIITETDTEDCWEEFQPITWTGAGISFGLKVTFSRSLGVSCPIGHSAG